MSNFDILSSMIQYFFGSLSLAKKKLNKFIMYFFWTFALLTLSYSLPARELSRVSVISIITAEPGEELYSTFGHSAIRIKDDLQNMDYVFNYGTFNFNTPNFYMKFARGKLPYLLSVQEYENFRIGYEYENRGLSEQVLNLTLRDKQAIFDFLMENYKPENRAYAYDFFYDNCATRIRDVFKNTLGDAIVFEDGYLPGTPTFRELINPYLKNLHWSKFGIYLALGIPADKLASPPEYMFLPDYLEQAFDKADYFRNDRRMPLVAHKNALFQSKIQPQIFQIAITPGLVFTVLFFVVALITYWEYKKDRYLLGFDVCFFSILGILGWVIFFLWFLTDHKTTAGNLNIFWASPLYFPLAFGLIIKKYAPFVRRVMLILMYIHLLIIFGWFALPQNFHPVIILILICCIIRALKINQKEKKALFPNK
ncbi:MAG: DUF4105 domain-containing protein [Cyclobacteriaceae bacterium]|nr:DUF4105 domain-containing protein [Cyclobacteriaceae bacterium]